MIGALCDPDMYGDLQRRHDNGSKFLNGGRFEQTKVVLCAPTVKHFRSAPSERVQVTFAPQGLTRSVAIIITNISFLPCRWIGRTAHDTLSSVKRSKSETGRKWSNIVTANGAYILIGPTRNCTSGYDDKYWMRGSPRALVCNHVLHHIFVSDPAYCIASKSHLSLSTACLYKHVAPPYCEVSDRLPLVICPTRSESCCLRRVPDRSWFQQSRRSHLWPPPTRGWTRYRLRRSGAKKRAHAFGDAR